MQTLVESAKNIEDFEVGSLTERLSALESIFKLVNKQTSKRLCKNENLTLALLESALVLKQTAGQINVVIHALGILLALPNILLQNEVVQYLSLGAGNAGKPFDLETNKRIAEFKFINWQGGSETIRQNSIFKDFYLLAEADTKKEKYLYILGLQYPLKFLTGGRSLKSVLSRNDKMLTDFQQRYGDKFSRVREYYGYRESAVKIIDLKDKVPEFSEIFA